MENRSRKKKDKKWILILLGIICIVIAFVLLILFLLQGNTKTISEGGSIEPTEAITCTSDEVVYPFFKSNDAKSRSMKINAIFDNDKLDIITLTYKLEYDDAKQAEQSSAENHAALNTSFYDDSMSADSFDAHFSVLKNSMQLSLHAEAKEITGTTAKYFLIDNVSGNHKKESLTKILNSKGLDCIINQ